MILIQACVCNYFEFYFFRMFNSSYRISESHSEHNLTFVSQCKRLLSLNRRNQHPVLAPVWAVLGMVEHHGTSLCQTCCYVVPAHQRSSLHLAGLTLWLYTAPVSLRHGTTVQRHCHQRTMTPSTRTTTTPQQKHKCGYQLNVNTIT